MGKKLSNEILVWNISHRAHEELVIGHWLIIKLSLTARMSEIFFWSGRILPMAQHYTVYNLPNRKKRLDEDQFIIIPQNPCINIFAHFFTGVWEVFELAEFRTKLKDCKVIL